MATVLNCIGKSDIIYNSQLFIIFSTQTPLNKISRKVIKSTSNDMCIITKYLIVKPLLFFGMIGTKLDGTNKKILQKIHFNWDLKKKVLRNSSPK